MPRPLLTKAHPLLTVMLPTDLDQSSVMPRHMQGLPQSPRLRHRPLSTTTNTRSPNITLSQVRTSTTHLRTSTTYMSTRMTLTSTSTMSEPEGTHITLDMASLPSLPSSLPTCATEHTQATKLGSLTTPSPSPSMMVEPQVLRRSERRPTWSEASAAQPPSREYPQGGPGLYTAPAHGGEGWPWAPGAPPPTGAHMPRGPHEGPLSAPPTHYYAPPPRDARDRRDHREAHPHGGREPHAERHHPYPRPPRSSGSERHERDRRASVGGWGQQHQRHGPSDSDYPSPPLSAPHHPHVVVHYPPHHPGHPPPGPAPGAHGAPPPHHHAPPPYAQRPETAPFDPHYSMRPHPASGWPRRDGEDERDYYARGGRSPSPRGPRDRRD
ncbi:hypothetical protein Q8F55_003814 [Vanrija albida]|uniref:Uncharacterized protein n=1 Tax=Vanrija albida TaxID=181172 RepID=A0ABR3Q5L3_9TREE